MKPISPCVEVCRMDGEKGVCIGCGRTLREIAMWSSMTEEERRRVMALLPERKKRSDASVSKEFKS